MVYVTGLRSEPLKHKLRKKYRRRQEKGGHREASAAVCPDDEAGERLAWFSQEAAQQERELADAQAARSHPEYTSRERHDQGWGSRDRRTPSPQQRQREEARLSAAVDARRTERSTGRAGLERGRSTSRGARPERTPAQQPTGAAGPDQRADPGSRQVMPGPRVLGGAPVGGGAARLCYRCGQPGHIRANCPAPDGPHLQQFQREHRLSVAEAVADLELVDAEEEDRMFRLEEERGSRSAAEPRGGGSEGPDSPRA